MGKRLAGFEPGSPGLYARIWYDVLVRCPYSIWRVSLFPIRTVYAMAY